MKEVRDIELLRFLCEIDAPSGSEAPVREAITEQLRCLPVSLSTDRVGNLVARKAGNGAARRRMMLSAHMDEVGFMITGIDEDGRLHFANIGGIDTSVLSGRAVRIAGRRETLDGVISAMPIHLRPQSELGKLTPAGSLRIDIGALSQEDAADLVAVGCVGTFRFDFTEYADGTMLCCKAIDDRIGCALLCDLIALTADEQYDYDLYFAFTTREEIGYSGAYATAQTLRPDLAFVLESTAVADLPDVPVSSRVASLGHGPAISFADRGTIYHKPLFDFLLATAKEHTIKAQPKCFTSGANDAAYIHASACGVPTAALSTPTRYLHSASCVIAREDYFSLRELLLATIRNVGNADFFTEAEQ